MTPALLHPAARPTVTDVGVSCAFVDDVMSFVPLLSFMSFAALDGFGIQALTFAKGSLEMMEMD